MASGGTVQLRRIFVFKGPSLIARQPLVRLTIAAEGRDLLSGSAVARKAAAALEALLQPETSLWSGGEARGNDISLAECIGRLAVALQREMGDDLAFHKVLPVKNNGEVEVAFAYADAVLAAQAARQSVGLVDLADRQAEPEAPSAGGEDPLARNFEQAIEFLAQNALPLPSRRNAWEAKRRGIPWQRLPYSEGAVQLGQGYKRRRFQRSYWQDTSFIAMKLATSKAAAADLLRRAGLPVPRNRLVSQSTQAVLAAEEIGYPVVVKPNGRDMGTAVSINIKSPAEVEAAFKSAARYGRVLIEEQIAGQDHRITVLQGRMIAAGSNIPPQVVGDGKSSISELVDRLNKDPLRGRRDYFRFKKIYFDPQILDDLSRQGFTPDSVPPDGQTVALRFWWRQAKDNTAIDLTDKVHPDNRQMFERAARVLGIDLAGIDYVSPDISRPWYEVGGAINEINPTPGLSTHVKSGTPDVHRIILETFVPPGDDGRIPLAAVTGGPEVAETLRTTAALLADLGQVPAAAGRLGISIAGARVTRDDATGPEGAEAVFADPLVTAAVLEVSEAATVARGLGFDRANALAVTAPPQSQEVLNLLLGVTRDLVALDFDDPEAAALRQRLPEGPRLLWVTRRPAEPALAARRGTEEMVLALDRSLAAPAICLWQDEDCQPVWTLSELPEACANPDSPQLTACLFALALALGLGYAPRQIARHPPAR
jgi:cyanophycin synthetase